MNRRFFRRVAALAAAASVGGYTINRFNHYKEALDYVSLDPAEAVDNLNATGKRKITDSIRSLEALKHLDTHQCKEATSHLTDLAWAQLALVGSELWAFNPKYGQRPEAGDCEEELSKIQLDPEWKRAFKHYSEAKICSEDDLHCPSWIRKSHPKRLQKLLSVLHKSTENCRVLIDQDIHRTLLKLFYAHRREEYKKICEIILNCVSNMSCCDRECAAAVLNEWLPTLAAMIREPVLREEPVWAHRILNNLLFSLEAADYKLPTNVYELVRPDLQRDISMDIVFVHGFRGSLWRTWRQQDHPSEKTALFWPREWLRLDIRSNVRVLGLDYPSRLLRFGEIMDSVEKRAQRFVQSLKDCGVGDRPVFFVCHSMGGLLVKKMLVESEELRKRTVGIVFIAVPNRGTPVMSSYLTYIRPTEDAKFLRADSAHNRELHDQFLGVSQDIPLIFSLIEMQPSPLLGRRRMIVPPESAVFERGAVYHLDEHHYSICKPADVNSAAYLIIVKAIKEALELVARGEATQ